MSNFNFFDWIREGVRRSVLLGVSDAADQLGAPPEDSAIQGRMFDLFEKKTPVKKTTRRVASSSGSAGNRKLGRTLKDVQTTEKAT